MPGGGNLVRSGRYRKTPRTPRSAHARYYYTRSLVIGSPVRRRPNSPQTQARCQSAPKVMDSHSRSASPREPSRPQHRPPSPPSSPAGFDNRAYQHDDADPNHNDSFASNQPHQNGHTKEANGDTKLEAVNLELINLTPKNGNAKKKDVEVDMNATNPYDEYFVPVNEHRKYMRGEKLYVTADKRGEKGGCKRPLCWTLLGLVVAAIVALIVLAATGILFTNSPTPLEPYNTSVSSARALGGIGHVHSHDHDHGHDHDHDQHDHHDHDHHDHSTELPTTQQTPEMQNNEEHNLSNVSEESGDMSVYVPKTVEGELRIDNKDFVSALEDPESEEYKEFTSTFSEALKRALFDRNTIDNGDNEIIVEVVGIKEGSIIVTYRIHWKPRSNAESNEDLLTANTLKSTLAQYLDSNNRMISVYHIAEDKMATRPVLDLCQISNNDCEHGCEFDDTILDFTCTCPHGQIQDMRSPKKCIHILDNSDREQNTENHTEKELKVLTLEDTDKMRAIPDEEKPDLQTVHMADDETAFDWKEPQHITPEATTENDEDVNYSHIVGQARSKNDDIEAETMKSEPQPIAEPNSEPEPTAEPKSNELYEPKPALESTVTPKSEIEPTDEPKPEPEPEPTAEPESVAEPQPEPEPTIEPEVITELKPESPLNSEPSSEPEPSPESELSSTQNSEPKPQPEPTAEPTAEPNFNAVPETSSESKPEPEPTVISKLDPESSKEVNLETETKPEPEPTSEPHLMVIGSEDKQKNNMESNLNVGTTQIPQTLFENEQVNVDSPEKQDDIKPENEMKPIIQDNMRSEIGLSEPRTTTRSSSNEEFEQQTTEHINMEKVGLDTESVDKFNDMNMSEETTTSRISISEPNIINEPSYEPKPEIISILSENNDKNKETVFTSTDNDDYLSNNEDSSLSQNNAQNSPDVNSQTSEDQITATEVTSIVSNEENKTEMRSSKNLNTETNIETSTTKDTMNNKDDVTFELLSKNDEKIGESTTKISEDVPIIPSITEKISEPTESSRLETTMSAEPTIQNEPPREKNLDELTSQLETIEPEKSTTTTQKIPMVEVQKENEFSINQQIQDSVENKNLMEVLENKNETNVLSHTTTTESTNHDENDVTFDAINMLFNRTSKSMEDSSVQQVTESIASSDSTETTDSDWLSEPVTEVNYKEAMNTMENHDTTETSISKIDEVINRGVSKDDFEPDYLNNMGSNISKMPEQDEPLYGMTHDYDNDDLREKRVNTKRKEPEVDDSNKNINDSKDTFESSSIVPVVENTSVTTVTEYIYKFSESFQNTSITDDSHSSDTIKDNDQDEASITETKVRTDNVTDDTISMPTTTEATSMISLDENQDMAAETGAAQNSTQVNNLNVTIYEISKHSGNQSHSTPNHTHPQSAEYDDHETEMNPFLPEAENNKVLVKKLQEGHDLEPVNLNETQNENIEDHITNISENASNSSLSQSNNGIDKSNIITANRDVTDLITTTEDNALFNELLVGSNSQSTEDDSRGTTVKSSPIIDETTEKSEKVLPISTFLLDTDDLDVPKHSLENNEKNEVPNSSTEATTTSTPKIETENDDSEYLSVVPIEPETLEDKEALKNFNSENIQELNYISDSPKKSDKRTLDTSNLDSIINNEA